jgi:UDP-N-acetylmuramyl tripeptide synthase
VLKTNFEAAINTPVTSEELKKRLSESLKEAKTQNDRALAVQMILEWMRHHNYVVLLGEK